MPGKGINLKDNAVLGTINASTQYVEHITKLAQKYAERSRHK